MQNSVRKEMMLGAIFLAAIVFLVFVTVSISKLNLFSHTAYIKVIFDNVSGLKQGDPVQVLGMDAGTVYKMKLQINNKVRAVLKLAEPVEIREDYKVTVEESSVLGGNFIEINPGTPGKKVVDLRAPLTGETSSAGLDALGELIRENKTEVREFLSQGAKIVKDASEGKGTLGKLLVDETLYNNLKDTSESLKNISKKVETGEGNLGKFLNDDQLYTDLKDSVESLKKTLKQIESNKGFLGKLIYDEKLAQQVSDAGDSVVKLLEPAVRTKVFLGVDGKFYPESKSTISDVSLRIEPRESKYFLLGASIMSLDKNGDVSFDKQSEDKDQTFIKANVQVAYRFYDNLFTFRTGLIEGKFGGAIDYEEPVAESFITKVAFSLEARDGYNSVEDEKIDENLPAAMVRAYGSVTLWNHLKIYVGTSRITSDTPEFMTGIAFEYMDEDIKSFITLLGLSR
ncbi:MAG: MlaD family protein [Planctomycetota bacterium]